MFLLELFPHFLAFLAPNFASLRHSARSESMKSAFFYRTYEFFFNQFGIGVVGQLFIIEN